MKKRFLAVLAASAVLGVAVAGATPQTSFEKGQWQLDLGAQNVDAETTNYDHFDNKWNFNGGLTYAFSDKTALQYRYHGLDVKDDYSDAKYNGDEHEVNLVQSLSKNVAVFGGWNRISSDLLDNNYAQKKTNNIAQLGLIAKADLGSHANVYALGALGTRNTSIWEAGLGYTFGDDFDLNVGYRYVNTELPNVDDQSATFKGLTLGLSYRFGGHKDVVEEPAYVAPTPEPAPVVEPAHENKDYYLQSIYFDTDKSNIKSSEVAKADQFVSAAKASSNVFKLSGNTDSDGSDDYNMALSQRRVASVAQYAIDRGVNPNQLRAQYNGESKPIASNATAAGKAENRRVDIWENK